MKDNKKIVLLCMACIVLTVAVILLIIKLNNRKSYEDYVESSKDINVYLYNEDYEVDVVLKVNRVMHKYDAELNDLGVYNIYADKDNISYTSTGDNVTVILTNSDNGIVYLVLKFDSDDNVTDHMIFISSDLGDAPEE